MCNWLVAHASWAASVFGLILELTALILIIRQLRLTRTRLQDVDMDNTDKMGPGGNQMRDILRDEILDSKWALILFLLGAILQLLGLILKIGE